MGGEVYMRNMRGSVDFLARHGLEFVKIDSGSAYNNMSLWWELAEASGKPIVVENCHQGHELPTATWCPFDFFRTSGDAHIVGPDGESHEPGLSIIFCVVFAWIHKRRSAKSRAE